jgi:hypothetical protein
MNGNSAKKNKKKGSRDLFEPTDEKVWFEGLKEHC